MISVLLIFSLIVSEGEEFLNGIVGVVNDDVITYRDIEIFSGIKELDGEELVKEEVLNHLIEESIVYQIATEQGIEPEAKVITKCVENIKRSIEKKGMNRMLEKAGYIDKDGEKRCLRAETVGLFIASKFLNPALVDTSKISKADLMNFKEIRIEEYKIWLNDAIKKFKIEKWTEEFNFGADR